MKRLLKFLARLYPPAWCKRYGAEFEALLEDRIPLTRDAFDILLGALKMQMATWSFVRIVVATALVGILAAVGFTFTLPSRYASKSVILVGPGRHASGRPIDSVGPDNVRALLVSPAMVDTLSTDSLASLIQKYNMYQSERARMPLQAVTNQMRRDITVRLLRPSLSSKAGGLAIEFSYDDPHVAQNVDQDLVSRWVLADLVQRRDLAAAGNPPHPTVFRILRATLPQKPTFPNRKVFGAGGLLAGLAVGLTLAALARFRQKNAAANG